MSNVLEEDVPLNAEVLWTVDDAARFLRVHRNTVCRAVHSGKLPAVQFLDSWRFFPEDVKEHLKSFGVKAKPAKSVVGGIRKSRRGRKPRVQVQKTAD